MERLFYKFVFLILLKLTNLFQTIITPYFAVTIARLFFLESWQEPQESKLIVTALILCNINPKLVHKFTKIVTIFRKIIRGFALYIFTFVIIRWVLSQFWIDLNVVISTNSISEVQFNQEV